MKPVEFALADTDAEAELAAAEVEELEPVLNAASVVALVVTVPSGIDVTVQAYGGE
jgi:hypothetical protein